MGPNEQEPNTIQEPNTGLQEPNTLDFQEPNTLAEQEPNTIDGSNEES